MSNETIITFLGQQTRNGTNGNTIVRLADLHPETHELKPFHQNPHAPRIFANRSFFTAPPETPDVTFGIWTAVLIPHRQPGRDYTKSFSYVPYLTPTRILDFHVSRSSIASILSSPYFHDLLDTIVIKGGCSLVFHYHTQDHSNEALYIDRSIVEPWNGSARIKPDTITLPVIHLDSKQLNIQPTKLSPRYNFLPYPGMPQEEHFLTVMPIVPLQEAVKVYLTKHVLTWRDFQKKSADVTHNDHSVYRAILDAVQGMEMRGDLQSLYGCSDKQFDAACEGVLHSARDLLFLNDVPDKALMMLVNQDKEFVHKIEERLSQGWIKKHGDMMEKARQALAEAHAAREDVLAKVREDEESLQRTESLIQDTEARRTSLEDDITRLEQARAEAERDLAAKIKAAQEAAAMAAEQARIAKRNMPRQETVRVVPVPASDPSSGASQTVSRFPPSVRAEDPEEISDSEGALEILEENLQTAGMSANAARDFARLACGAYREKIPLVLAGPCAIDIADAVSLSLFASKARVIDLETRIDAVVPNDSVVLCRNGLELNRLEKALGSPFLAGRMVFYEVPFAEELALLSPGLYNFAVPVCTELFLVAPTLDDFYPGLVERKAWSEARAAMPDGLPEGSPTELLSPFAEKKLEALLNAGVRPTNRNSLARLLLLPLHLLRSSLDELAARLEEDEGIDEQLRKRLLRLITIYAGRR